MPSTPSTPRTSDLALALLAGGVALTVAHSIGRFGFTPLLPHFLADGMLSLEQGASLATWNYIGYLIGALIAVGLARPPRLRPALVAALLSNALFTLAQAFTESYLPLLVLRLGNGISNGVVFVLAPALVLEWLAWRQRSNLSGWVYLGVALGLLLSNGLANWPAQHLDGAARWLPMAAVALPLAVVSAWKLGTMRVAPKARLELPPATPLFDRASTPLFLAYVGAGLGYILPVTFLPTLAKAQLQAGDPLIVGAWRWTAMACVLSVPLWNYLGARLGDRHALMWSYALQAVGAAAPLLWPGRVGILLCALLVGVTFLGSVMLTQRLARTLQPHQGPKLSAALIALYGGAQLTGPWLAGLWIAQGGSLTQSFAIGAGALIWGLVWSYLIPERRATVPAQ